MTSPGAMLLSDLVRGLAEARVVGDPGVAVTGISYDSRKVSPGDLFAAIPGTRTDGTRFIPGALEAGARAVLAAADNGSLPVPAVIAPDVRLAMGKMAARLFAHPDHKLTIIGITGTNGKTTTSYLLEAILKAAGKSPGVIGTINYRFQDSMTPAQTTTPESVDIFKIISRMAKKGATHVIMEISSHALDQKRVSGLRVRSGIFTNLSRDHLDYHRDLEDYYRAKRKLFTEVITGSWAADLPEPDTSPRAVVNLDDPFGVRLASELEQRGVPCLGFGIASSRAEVRVREVRTSEQGISARLVAPEAQIPIASRLIGGHNLENILAAAAAAFALGTDPEAVGEGINSLDRVPGRLEPVDNRVGITLLVDYAHTPDALAHAVDTCRGLTKKRLITVFGCGGDRDPGKRPEMGRIALSGSQIAVVTSDNPRTEDPLTIIDHILEGIKKVPGQRIEPEEASGAAEEGKAYLVEPDRKKAIRLSIGLARPGDMVLIAGKGHEDYQILGTEKIHFDDREEAKKALLEREQK